MLTTKPVLTTPSPTTSNFSTTTASMVTTSQYPSMSTDALNFTTTPAPTSSNMTSSFPTTTNVTSSTFIVTTTEDVTSTTANILEESQCLKILYEDIGESRIRIWDIVFLIPNSLFLLFMIYRLRRVWHRVMVPSGSNNGGNSPIFPTYFTLVGISALLSFSRCIVSMTVDLASLSGTDANKILWLILRFFLLMSELSVLIFGLAFGHLDSRKGIKRILIITTLIALLYSSIQGYLELGRDDDRFDIPEDDWTVFQHGGALFAFISSLFFLCLYTFVIILPYIRWLQRYLLVPTRRSFYVYVLVMFLINFVSTLGSGLLYYYQAAGLCLLDLSSLVYYGYFAPLVYWTFLSSYFGSARPNNILFSYNSQIDDDINDVVDYDVNAFNVDSSLSGILEFHQPNTASMMMTSSGGNNAMTSHDSSSRGGGRDQPLHDLAQLTPNYHDDDDDDDVIGATDNYTVGFRSDIYE